jgi:riboflavin kinase/FMN adenylyltransferase
VRVLRGLDRRLRRPLSLALGVFDGIHLGHQRVICASVREAVRTQSLAAVLTFEPHPDAVLDPKGVPALLTTTDEKLALLQSLGIQLAVLADFDRKLADMPADHFVHEILVNQLRARCVVVGEKWRFGEGGKGTPALLHQLSHRLGFRPLVVPSVTVAGAKVSSTRVRSLLAKGRVGAARQLLGRPYQLAGRVVSGAGLGRKLGYPTANLQAAPEKLVPADGIYASWAGRRRLHPAVAYVGARPTFESGGVRRIEVHLLRDARGAELLGRRLRIEFVQRLRADRKFSSPEALVAQMARDCGRARRVLHSLQS